MVRNSKQINHLLILSLSVGSGHTLAAEAVLQMIGIYAPNTRVTHLDIAPLVSTTTRVIHKYGYHVMQAHAPFLWGALYHATNTRPFDAMVKISTGIQAKTEATLNESIERLRPDAILCTYFGCADMIRRSKAIQNIPISVVMTDYHAHRAFAMPHVSRFFVPSMEQQRVLVSFGIPEATIRTAGIPVRPAFYEQKDTTLLRTRLRISSEKPCILIMYGGRGLLEMEQAVRVLLKKKEPTTIVAMTGKNIDLYDILHRLSVPAHISLMMVGWTERIDEYMRLADVVITKPGGITVSECMTLGKPMLLVSPTPGHEIYNARHVVQNGCGYLARSLNEILSILEKNRFLPYQQNATNSTRMICEEILKIKC